MRALGIDIGGTSVKAGVLQGERVVATRRSSTYANPAGDDLRAVIGAVVSGLNAEAGAGGAFGAVGVSAPGLLDEARGVITKSVNLPGIVGLPLRELAREAAGNRSARVELCTDAHATAVDVWRSETPRANGRMLVLVMGTGVGASVLDDGVPLWVSGHSPGHLGQVDVRVDEPGRAVALGPDGGRGSLEAYVGVAALMSRYSCVADAVAGRFGDEPGPMEALVRAIRIAHAIYRPDHVRLAGGVGIRLGHEVERLRRMVNSELTGVARAGWTLGCGTSDFHAALGAAWICSR